MSSEASSRAGSPTAGVPVATVKYYLREGLLPPGRRDCPPPRPTTATPHLARLRLVRALVEMAAGSPWPRSATVLGAVDAGPATASTAVGTAHAHCGRLAAAAAADEPPTRALAAAGTSRVVGLPRSRRPAAARRRPGRRRAVGLTTGDDALRTATPTPPWPSPGRTSRGPAPARRRRRPRTSSSAPSSTSRSCWPCAGCQQHLSVQRARRGRASTHGWHATAPAPARDATKAPGPRLTGGLLVVAPTGFEPALPP